MLPSKSAVKEKMDESDDSRRRRIKKYAHYRRLRIAPWSQRGCNKDVGLIKLAEGQKWGKRKQKAAQMEENTRARWTTLKGKWMETIRLLMTSPSVSNQVSDWRETGDKKDPSCQAIDCSSRALR